jgi:hypothetical protein
MREQSLGQFAEWIALREILMRVVVFGGPGGDSCAPRD